MNPDTIARYQKGGDLYQSYALQYGAAGADQIAAAAATGVQSNITDAIVQLKYGAPLNTSTASIFLNQITTDPLAAPLASANNVIGNSVFSFLKNPWVIGSVVVVLFIWMGGLSLLKGSLKK